MAKANVKDRLAQAKKLYGKTEARTGARRLPPGVGYTGIIKDPVLEISKNDRLQVVWPITVTSPDEFEGVDHRDWSGLETENNIAFFKGRLEKIGVDVPDDISDIGDALDACDGLHIRFDVVKVEEYTNTYFTEQLADQGGDDSKEPEEPEEPEHTAKSLSKLGRSADKEDDDAIAELEALAKDNKLDPDDYPLWTELADAVAEELGL